MSQRTSPTITGIPIFFNCPSYLACLSAAIFISSATFLRVISSREIIAKLSIRSFSSLSKRILFQSLKYFSVKYIKNQFINKIMNKILFIPLRLSSCKVCRLIAVGLKKNRSGSVLMLPSFPFTATLYLLPRTNSYRSAQKN